jgi:hypothetical protein
MKGEPVMRKNKPIVLGILAILIAATMACEGTGGAQPTAAPMATDTPMPTATPTPTATPEPETTSHELPSGWIQFTDNELRYSVQFPPGWIVLDLTVGDLQSGIDQVGQMNPDLAPLLQNAAQTAAQGLRVMIMDPSPDMIAIGFPANLSIIAMDESVTMGLSVNVLLSATEQAVPAMFPGATVLFSDMIPDIDGHTAGALEYTVTMPTALGTDVTIHMTQVLVQLGDIILSFNFSAEADAYSRFADTLDQIIGSIDFF